ncbi:hypothetical protein [Olleya sp. UBA1516]|uniref:hypothetical protein n=1 Tax=Olleya sp. UBA1516 TaxID=1947013 RepID=UPI0025DCDD17|nr:hypothetical protein [Olleya sp. UBA1516]|tara:strand:+ start:234368 stop:234988 length:621 start_codon:yes stop_codon:yes gene_type:complete
MKSSKITQRIAALLLLLLFMITANGQTKHKSNSSLLALETLNLITFINTLNAHPNDFYKGEMTLTDGTILIGYFSLNNSITDNYVVLHDDGETYHYYCKDEINDVMLYNPNSDSNTVFEFIKDDGKLYRKVYDNNKDVIVYDTANYPFDNTLVDQVIIDVDNQLIETWNFWTSGPKHDLIKYLRDRDNIRYKRNQFKSLDDIFEKL